MEPPRISGQWESSVPRRSGDADGGMESAKPDRVDEVGIVRIPPFSGEAPGSPATESERRI